MLFNVVEDIFGIVVVVVEVLVDKVVMLLVEEVEVVVGNSVSSFGVSSVLLCGSS